MIPCHKGRITRQRARKAEEKRVSVPWAEVRITDLLAFPGRQGPFLAFLEVLILLQELHPEPSLRSVTARGLPSPNSQHRDLVNGSRLSSPLWGEVPPLLKSTPVSVPPGFAPKGAGGWREEGKWQPVPQQCRYTRHKNSGKNHGEAREEDSSMRMFLDLSKSRDDLLVLHSTTTVVSAYNQIRVAQAPNDQLSLLLSLLLFLACSLAQK